MAESSNLNYFTLQTVFQCMTCSLIYMNLSRYLLNNFELFTGTFEVQHLFYKSFVLVLHYYPILSDLLFRYEKSDLSKQLYLQPCS